MPVPHNPPLQDNEGPCHFVAGWNMPGYLPSMEPAFFAEFDDANRWLLNQLEELEDEYAIHGDDESATEVSHIRQDLNLKSQPFTFEFHGVAYWVESTEHNQ